MYLITDKNIICKLQLALYKDIIYRILSVLKVKTDIIASITVRPIGQALMLVKMYVKTKYPGLLYKVKLEL